MTLRLARVDQACKEAVRFISTVRELQEAHPHGPRYDQYKGGKLTAAVRRASMDLTRALTALRRGDED